MPITVVRQSNALYNIFTANPSLAFQNQVQANNVLVAIASSMGYGSAAGIVSEITDTVNPNQWVEIGNTGSQTTDDTHYYSLAAYKYVGGLAGTPTVNFTMTVGQSPGSIAIFELPFQDIDKIAFPNYIEADGSGDLTTPNTSAVQAGDAVMAIMGGYSSSATVIGLNSEN